jgi:hypothetical protein
MLRSLLNLLHLDPGFQQQHVLTANLSLPSANYKESADLARFYDRLAGDLSSIPGVESAGVGSDLPWTGYDENSSFHIEGKYLLHTKSSTGAITSRRRIISVRSAFRWYVGASLPGATTKTRITS